MTTYGCSPLPVSHPPRSRHMVDRWADAGAGPPVQYRGRACGEIIHVELRCAKCGTTMRAGDVDLLDGPGRHSA